VAGAVNPAPGHILARVGFGQECPRSSDRKPSDGGFAQEIGPALQEVFLSNADPRRSGSFSAGGAGISLTGGAKGSVSGTVTGTGRA